MSTPTMDDAAKVLADPTAYADEDRLHTALTHLRAHAPVTYVDHPPYRPFWAVTKHADIMEIERANDLWISEPRPLLMTAERDDVLRAQLDAGMGLRTLIHMDDPHHRDVRQCGADWFRPKAMRDLKVRVDELSKRTVDKMCNLGSECDFVADIAMDFPLYVIMSLLGIPEDDFPRMLKLTQEMFGGDDTELQRGTSVEDLLEVLLDFFNYFNALTASRRETPTEDLASAIANARINGEPLSDLDTVSYYVIIASAGHDTTKDAISGGLRALIENPDQLARLRDQPELMPTAVEELLRAYAPVTMARLVTEDVEYKGCPMKAGDKVLMNFPAANRDPEAFEQPDVVQLDRAHNRHVAFGSGIHRCAGSNLARMELQVALEEWLARIPEFALAEGQEVTWAGGQVRGPRILPVVFP